MLRVLLGSHEAGERHQWRQWLSEAPLEVVGLAQDGQEAVQLALQLRPDLVLLEVFEQSSLQDYPNPDRIGCPGQPFLRKLAFDRKSIPFVMIVH